MIDSVFLFSPFPALNIALRPVPFPPVFTHRPYLIQRFLLLAAINRQRLKLPVFKQPRKPELLSLVFYAGRLASLFGLIGYLVKGLISREVLYDFAISLLAVLPAIFLGRFLNRRLKGQHFFKYVC